jgi:glycosyltransferase involved in cell wall biosynthesis/SAM-dependent methyltransferase
VPDRLHIIFFGTYDEGRHPRVRVLREGLLDRGHDVMVLNSPLDVDTAGRVRLAAQPWRAPWFVARLVGAWARLLWRSRGIHRPDVVIVGYLGQFDVHLARCRWPRAQLVLDHMVSLVDTVRDRGLDRAATVRVLELIDDAAAAQADVVLVDTARQAEQVPTRHGSKVVVVPVGAPHAWFEAGARRSEGTRTSASRQRAAEPLSVVFFGLFTPLQGAPTIGRAIRHLADREIRWTMIGDGQDRDATMREAGGAEVTWLDWVDAGALPRSVAAHDVCLGIFGTGAKAARVVPNKVYQGAAAGCAVVTSATEAQREVLGDAAVYTPPGDAAALSGALAALDDDRTTLAARRRAASHLAVAAFTPRSVVGGLADALVRAHDDGMPHGASTQPPLPPNAALRWHLVEQHLDALRPTSILECGAGQGAAGSRLAARASYVGIEPDETSRSTAASRLPAGARLLASIDELDDSETFDLVCAFEVLEHIEDDRRNLKQWVERVEPGGHVLVSVPADPRRYAPADELAGHFRRYSDTDLSDLLESAGLSPLSIRRYGYPLGLVLEAGRNAVARRRLARAAGPSDVVSRTAASGRHLQPPIWSSKAIWWSTAPFRHVQSRFPDRGPGLLAVARRPD